jgi:hypothetical protein
MVDDDFCCRYFGILIGSGDRSKNKVKTIQKTAFCESLDAEKKEQKCTII